MKPARVRLDTIVVREDLYPRHEVSPANVAALKAKREAGVTLDPIIVGRLPGMTRADPSVIVDGAHRRAVHEAAGEQWVMVDERSYDSEAALLADAAALNSMHGLNLTSFDRLKTIGICERLGISEEQTASMLMMSTSQVQALQPRYAAMADPSGGIPVRVPLKASVRHMAGKVIRAEQAAAIRGIAPGASYLLLTRQLISGLENDLLPPEDTNPALWAELRRLRSLIPG
jgi:hypothetical protein